MKIAIVGNSGSGKTTLAKDLSDLLGIPRIELDQYFHQPHWTNPTSEEFKATVTSLIHTHTESGWIIDGNYQRRLDGLVPNSADLIICSYLLFLTLSKFTLLVIQILFLSYSG